MESLLTKEHWILQINLRSLEFFYNNVTVTGAKDHMKNVIKSMRTQKTYT